MGPISTEGQTEASGSPSAPEPRRAVAEGEFQSLFETFAPKVWGTLRRLGVAESDIEDVCQEVFMVVYRKLGDFEGRSSVSTWIYSICVRTASDYRRRAHRRKEVTVSSPPEQSAPDPALREVELRELRAILDEALDTLEPDWRAIFVLYEYEDLSMREVAEAVGCPLQTAYSRYKSARNKVLQAVNQAVDWEDGP